MTGYTLTEVSVGLGIAVTILGLLTALVRTVWTVARELAALKTNIDVRFTALASQIQENRAHADIAFARLSAREEVQASKEWTRELVQSAIDQHCHDCPGSFENSGIHPEPQPKRR